VAHDRRFLERPLQWACPSLAGMIAEHVFGSNVFFDLKSRFPPGAMLPAVDTFSSGLAGFPTEFRSRYRHAAALATLKRPRRTQQLVRLVGNDSYGARPRGAAPPAAASHRAD
jgi:hypothetical protein